MKSSIIIMLALSLTAMLLVAQGIRADTTETDLIDCTNYINIEEDRVTGTTSAGSKDILIVVAEDDPDKIFGIDIWSTSSVKATVLDIQIRGGANCISTGDRINVLFRDGTRLEASNISDFNCEPKFSLYFGDVFGREQILKQFGEKEVEIMRIQTMTKSVEIEFSEKNSQAFMNLAKCMIDYANR
jgi:hypothetical protein